jgi:hypothetical protein
MDRSTSRRGIAAFLAIALLLVVAVLATGVVGRSEAPAPSDPPASEAPSPKPTATPAPSEAPIPSETPGEVGFDLDIATPHDVSVVIDDQTDRVVDARSGQAGAGMSVRWFDSIVENVGAESVRITWVGLPQDDEVRITISQDGDEVVVHIDQAAPPANSDAMGHDRVVEISFDGPVAASDVEVSVSN